MVIVDRRATIVFLSEQRSKKAGFPAKEIRMADKSARLPDNVKGNGMSMPRVPAVACVHRLHPIYLR